MPLTLFRLPLILFALLLALIASPTRAADPLEPEKAFPVHARALDPDTVEVVFDVANGYYLYGERFRFEVTPPEVTLGEVKRPPGTLKDDPLFGKVETYHGQLRLLVPIVAPTTAVLDRFTLAVTSQGCWEGGVCYPPMTQRFEIDRTASSGTSGGGSLLKRALLDTSSPVPASDKTPPAEAEGDETGRIASLLFAAGDPLVLASFFGFGLLLAFTPCTFPMIPILSGIIVGAGRPAGRHVSRGRALALSLAYVLGMALTYAAAGVAAGLTGTLLAAVLQNVWVLAAFALLFVVLALSMFGLFELQLPSALQSRLADSANREKGGHLGGVAAMGALSALIVGPCVTAPLAGALLYIAKTGDAVLGGIALFVLALGMGVPLIVIALTAHSVLPKIGPWMEWVKKATGVLLLGVALWVISPVLPPLAIFQADATAPAAHTAFLRINSEAELDAQLAATDRPVLLDFYADWCATCKEMERDTFSDPAVAARMARMRLLQVDVTAYTGAHKALLQRFDLVGPPGILFFDAAGQQLKTLRSVGFVPAKEFTALLDRAL